MTEDELKAENAELRRIIEEMREGVSRLLEMLSGGQS